MENRLEGKRLNGGQEGREEAGEMVRRKRIQDNRPRERKSLRQDTQ